MAATLRVLLTVVELPPEKDGQPPRRGTQLEAGWVMAGGEVVPCGDAAIVLWALERARGIVLENVPMRPPLITTALAVPPLPPEMRSH